MNGEGSEFWVSHEHMNLDVDAMRGLEEGDLLPLAALLRSGLPVGQDIRDFLADAIEGRNGFRPLKVGHDNGWVRPHERIRRELRDEEIGAYLFVRKPRAKRGEFKNILADAAARFGMSVELAKKAYAAFSARVAQGDEDDEIPLKMALDRAWKEAFPDEYDAWRASLEP